MINLKKPLEGVPGLLLMAALVFFGATIGVTVALALSWVEMKDSIANFLGGVVGAGLGSALAIMGALYVQRQERRDRQKSLARLLHSECDGLLTALRALRDCVATLLSNYEDELREGKAPALRTAAIADDFARDVRALALVLEDVRERESKLANVVELDAATNFEITEFRYNVSLAIRSSRSCLELHGPEMGAIYSRSANEIAEYAIERAKALSDVARKLG